jgi:integrase
MNTLSESKNSTAPVAQKPGFYPVGKGKRRVQGLYVRFPGETYYCRSYVGKKNVWTSLETRQLDLAKERLREFQNSHLSQRKLRESISDGELTVGQLAGLVRFPRTKKPSSVEYRDNCTKRIFKIWPALKDMKPKQVSFEELQDKFKAAEAEYSNGVINGTLDSLRAIFDLAIEKGLISKNPAEKIHKLHVEAKRFELPTDSQFAAIVEALKAQDSPAAILNADLVRFLAFSGLRIDEARNVLWSDIEFEKNRIYVRPGKNNHFRYVPITNSMRALLQDMKDLPRYSRSRERRNGNYVLAATECIKELTDACAKVGAPRITHHDLRHLFASRCIENGIDIPTISRWLGHLDGGVLAMRVYGHLRDAHSQAMVAKLNF